MGRARPLPGETPELFGSEFEWTAADGLVGITAIELDADGLITRVTSVYDGRQVSLERRTALLAATFA